MNFSNYLIERKACPICGSVNLVCIFSTTYENLKLRSYLESFYGKQGKIEFEYLMGATYSLLKCLGCKFIFQKYIPNDFLSKKLYEEWIDPKLSEYFHLSVKSMPTRLFYAEEIVRIISLIRKEPKEIEILDFGMGWGSWALMAKAFGCKVYGIELSQCKIEHALQNGLKILTSEELQEYKFDFINAEQVFEHLSYPLDTLKSLKSALKEKGIIKLSVPQCHNIEKRLRKPDWFAPRGSKSSLNAVAPLEHINCYSRNSILEMGQSVGLRNINMPICIQYTYAFSQGSLWQVIKNILLPIYNRFLRKGNYLFFSK